MKKNWMKRILPGLMVVIVILAGVLTWYIRDYYHAGNTAESILADESLVKQEADWLYLDSLDSDETGLIFYPGAKVEYTAHLPLMERFYRQGFDCFLVEMPGNLAFFGANRATDVMEAHPEIEHWYIMGHSLGGAFASSYAADHEDIIDGLVLLGAYNYGDYSTDQTITLYGTEDQVLNMEKIEAGDLVAILEGGNHAQFGDYGEQDGDGVAMITPEEQWDETVRIVIQWMD